MRLLIYKLMTQAIILFGRLRDMTIEGQRIETITSRCFDVYTCEHWACCDCGAYHYFKYFGPEVGCDHKPLREGMIIAGHCWPMRPKGYDYSWRVGAWSPTFALERIENDETEGGKT